MNRKKLILNSYATWQTKSSNFYLLKVTITSWISSHIGELIFKKVKIILILLIGQLRSRNPKLYVCRSIIHYLSLHNSSLSLSFNQSYLLMSCSLWSHLHCRCVYLYLAFNVSYSFTWFKGQKAAFMSVNYGCSLRTIGFIFALYHDVGQICTTWEAVQCTRVFCARDVSCLNNRYPW